MEPYLSFTLFVPQEYLSRAYKDAPKYCAVTESAVLENEADGVLRHCSRRKKPFSFLGKRYIIKQRQIEDCGGNNGYFKR